MRTAWHLLSASLLLLPLLLLTGCGGDDGGNSNSNNDPAADNAPPLAVVADEPKEVDPSSLPKLGAYLPPLEGGTVQVAPPDGWSPLQRKAEYLVRFFHEDKTQLPRIEVTTEANPLADFGDVTPDNVGEYAEKMIPLSTKGGRKVIEPCLPLTFGGSAWSRHVRLAKSGSGMVQIQSLQTVRGGKLFTVELLVDGEEAAKLKKYKDFGYAVAAGMKFEGEGAEPAKSFELPAPAEEK